MTNMDEAAGPSNSGIASSRELADQVLQDHLDQLTALDF